MCVVVVHQPETWQPKNRAVVACPAVVSVWVSAWLPVFAIVSVSPSCCLCLLCFPCLFCLPICHLLYSLSGQKGRKQAAKLVHCVHRVRLVNSFQFPLTKAGAMKVFDQLWPLAPLSRAPLSLSARWLADAIAISSP